MIRQQSNAAFLQVDETPIPYQKPGTGKMPQGYLWVSRSTDGTVVYHWHSGRSAKCLESIIAPEFSGTLQCDGFSPYSSFQKQHPACIELAGCWAHVQRKFFQEQDRAPPQTAWILGQIGQLYRIEAAVRNSGPALHCARRAAQSAPILKRLHKLSCASAIRPPEPLHEQGMTNVRYIRYVPYMLVASSKISSAIQCKHYCRVLGVTLTLL